MTKKISVEVQYFRGCPNSNELIKRTKDVINNFKDLIEYKEILVEDNNTAEIVKFRGSPTVLIDGKDLEGLPEPEKPAMTCRYYQYGLPSKKVIKNNIENCSIFSLNSSC